MAGPQTPTLSPKRPSNARTRSKSNALAIRAEKGRRLSKEQRSFNRLTKRIAELERKIASERARLDRLLDRYREQVSPVEQDLAKAKSALVKALADATSRLAVAARQQQTLRAMILDLCAETFRVVKPDAETEAIYDEWARTSYREELRKKDQQRKREMAEEMRYEFGIDVKIPDDDSPEEMARFVNRLREEARTAEERKSRKGSGRNASRENREETAGQQEITTKKAIRDMYLSLAKILHPDAVLDPAERAVREQFMKQATLAYRQGDVTELLKLELRWVSERTAADTVSDDALRVYLPALQEQVARLQDAFEEHFFDPRYFPINPVADMDDDDALDAIDRRGRDLRMEAVETERLAGIVRRCATKAELVRVARDYVDAKSAEHARLLKGMIILP